MSDADELAPERPNRRERRTRETRRAILSTARELFETNGYAQTTVEQIAVGADVAPRTFFRYFPTKESLLFASYDDLRSEMLEWLDERPTDENPMVSISLALGELAEQVEQRRDDLTWGFRMVDELGVEGAYERSLIKENTHARIAEFVAGRLGVDPAEDPRPLAWTMAVMAVFGSVMRTDAHRSSPRSASEALTAFDDLLLSTADALRTSAEARTTA